MTNVLSTLGGKISDDDDKGMTLQNIEKKRRSGKSSSPPDPLGSNSEIARKLRQYYEELVSDDVPERFSHLLEQLEREEQPQSETKEG